MESMGALAERIRGVERRADAAHQSLGYLRGKSAEHDTAITVVSHDLEDIREDLRGVQGQLKWVLRGIGLTILTLLTTGTGIIVAILTQHG